MVSLEVKQLTELISFSFYRKLKIVTALGRAPKVANVIVLKRGTASNVIDLAHG